MEPLLVQPCFKRNSVLRKLDGRKRRFLHWNGVVGGGLRAGHRGGKAPVLRQRGAAHALQRQQTVLPLAVQEQALLRAVAQGAFVVLPAPGHAPAQAQLFQQVLHRAGIVAGQRQVVRAHRAGDAVHLHAAAVATGRVFQLQQGEVVVPGQAQRARRRQPGDAAAGDHGVHVPREVGRARGPGLAQPVAARVAVVGKTAFDGLRRVARAGRAQQCAGAGRQPVAAAPAGAHSCTRPHSVS